MMSLLGGRNQTHCIRRHVASFGPENADKFLCGPDDKSEL